MSWELKTSFILGVLHSLEPGHGKTAMLAMMLDQRKKWSDSFSLALSAVFSHSALMLVIALLTHFGSHLLLGSDINHFFADHFKLFASSLLIVIGLSLFMNSKKEKKKCCGGHDHEEGRVSRMPILLGITIGLYPCPTLIATYVTSVSGGQFDLGVAAVGLFTLGSFLSLLCSAFILKFIGSKVTGKLKSHFSRLNWSRIQALLIITVGLGAMLH